MQNVRMTLYAPHNGSEMHTDAHNVIKKEFLKEGGYTACYGTGNWLNPMTCMEEVEPVVIYTVVAKRDKAFLFDKIAHMYKELAGQQEVLYVIEECQARSI
jgi:hypothetical protein